MGLAVRDVVERIVQDVVEVAVPVLDACCKTSLEPVFTGEIIHQLFGIELRKRGDGHRQY